MSVADAHLSSTAMELPGAISACLIVRDEQARIASCLTALRQHLGPLLLEVVVYDTGSEDQTRRIAADLGAVVIDGYWDDDFARARNEALAAASGDWILIIDADEVVEADPTLLTRSMASLEAQSDGLACWVTNIDEHGEQTERARRCALFRRGRLTFRGAVHEALRRTDGTLPAVADVGVNVLHIAHHGYRDQTHSAEKVRRNARISDLEIEALRDSAGADADALPWALFHRARSRMSAAEREEMASEFREAADLAREPALRHASLECLMDVHLERGEFDAASACIEALVREGAVGNYGLWGAVRVSVGLGDLTVARDLLAGLDHVQTSLGVEAPPHYLWEARAQVAEAIGDQSAALANLLTSMLQTGQVAGRGVWLARLWDGDGAELTELVGRKAPSPERAAAILAELDAAR